jgi:hypothetical protein
VAPPLNPATDAQLGWFANLWLANSLMRASNHERDRTPREVLRSIVGGRKAGPDGQGTPIQIVSLERGPVEGSVTFSTLGLNFHQLKSATSSQLIRHELVMLARIGAVPKNLTAVLQQVAAEAITRGYAYLRGEVIGPVGKLFAESEFTALYVFQSLLFPHRICCRWTSGVRLAHPNHNRRSRSRSS